MNIEDINKNPEIPDLSILQNEDGTLNTNSTFRTDFIEYIAHQSIPLRDAFKQFIEQNNIEKIIINR